MFRERPSYDFHPAKKEKNQKEEEAAVYSG